MIEVPLYTHVLAQQGHDKRPSPHFERTEWSEEGLPKIMEGCKVVQGHQEKIDFW